MGRFMKGDIVVIPFPFSDLSSSKRRPALVLSELEGDDVILCQITSKEVDDIYAIPLLTEGFTKGTLKRESNIRPNRIFTADESIIAYKAGEVRQEVIKSVVDKVIEIITA
jgi:mRNA interferase MazF